MTTENNTETIADQGQAPDYAPGQTKDVIDRVRALQAWGERARYIIARRVIEASTLDNDVITYRALYDECVVAGLKHPPVGQWFNWIGDVLFALSQINKANEEPLFTAFVVRNNTYRVGDGYYRAVLERYGVLVDNQLDHAYIERAKVRAVLR